MSHITIVAVSPTHLSSGGCQPSCDGRTHFREPRRDGVCRPNGVTTRH